MVEIVVEVLLVVFVVSPLISVKLETRYFCFATCEKVLRYWTLDLRQ